MVRALPVSSLDDDDDMQWEAAEADYAGGAADGSGQEYGNGAAGGHPEGLRDLAGSPPTSWEDRHELQGAQLLPSLQEFVPRRRPARTGYAQLVACLDVSSVLHGHDAV